MSYFNYENTTVFLLCHGSWAKQLLSEAKMFFGIEMDAEIFPLLEDMSVQEYQEQIEKKLDASKQTILITDLLEGTPSKAALRIAYERKDIHVFTGLNLSLLLELDRLLNNGEVSVEEMLREVSEKTNIDLIKLFNLSTDETKFK